MQFGEGRTVFNELVPSDPPGCSDKGGYGCFCDRNIDCNQAKFLECSDGKVYRYL